MSLGAGVAAPVELAYRYAAPSGITTGPSGPRLSLATSGGAAANPRLFTGTVRHPEAVADALLAVAAVARSRFHTPPAMLTRILLAADPIVTCGDERIRFEGFSADCSVYARLDLLASGVDGQLLGRGTTNVDLGPQMRAALASVDATGLRLDIGVDELGVSTGSEHVIERRVPLPARWIRGLTELAAIQSTMTERAALSKADALRLLRSLGRSGAAREAWLVSTGSGGVRVAHHAASGSIRIGGPERLRVLDRVARHVRGLRIHAAQDGSTAWRCDLPGGRVTLVLSPDPWRGLSGEGRLLSALASPPSKAALAAVRAQLRWQATVTAATVSAATGLDATEAGAALAALAASGLLGMDLADGGYFHRELPFDLDAVDRRQPRLRDARRLVDDDGVRVERGDGREVVAWVAGSDVDHRVRMDETGATCTCPWFGRHRGERGPCKHVLAVQLVVLGLAEEDGVGLA